MFEVLDKCRSENGYLQKKFKQYKNYCNKKYNSLNSKSKKDGLIYKLESNLAKYWMFDSVVFLKKNIKLLQHQDEKFYKLYLNYTSCLLKAKLNLLHLIDLIEIKDALANFYTFYHDIVLLNTFDHDFDDDKIIHMWNDIRLSFDSPTILKKFLENNLNSNDHRFYIQVGIKINNLEKSQQELFDLLSENNSKIDDYFKAAQLFAKNSETLNQFLKDNFIKSSYVKFIEELLESSKNLLWFLESLSNRNNLDFNSQDSIYVPPKMFEKHQVMLSNLKTKITTSNRSLRSSLIECLEENFSIDIKKRRMPFLPEFYDLAYDFIAYPYVNSISSTLKTMNLSDNKYILKMNLFLSI